MLSCPTLGINLLKGHLFVFKCQAGKSDALLVTMTLFFLALHIPNIEGPLLWPFSDLYYFIFLSQTPVEEPCTSSYQKNTLYIYRKQHI